MVEGAERGVRYHLFGKLSKGKEVSRYVRSLSLLFILYTSLILLGKGTRSILKSHIPPASLSTLVASLKRAHAKLLLPPPAVQSDADKLSNWKPKIRREIDWHALLAERAVDEPDPAQEGEEALGDDQLGIEKTREELDEEANLKYLTIGLIGSVLLFPLFLVCLHY